MAGDGTGNKNLHHGTLALNASAASTQAMNLQRMQEKSPEALLEPSQQPQQSQLSQTSQKKSGALCIAPGRLTGNA